MSLGGVVAWLIAPPKADYFTSPLGNVIGAALIAALMPIYARYPVMLLLPAIAAASAAATHPWRRMAGQFVPGAVVLAWVLAGSDGMRAGVATALLAFGLWLAIGSVTTWMGRGFVVVANEVKELAYRTGGSAGEIAEMMRLVQQQVDASTSAILAIADMVMVLKTDQSAMGESVDVQVRNVGEIGDAATIGVDQVSRIGEAIRRLEAYTNDLSSGDPTTSKLSDQVVGLEMSL
jgi:hypothetical protein